MSTPKILHKSENEIINSIIERLPKEIFVKSTRKALRGLVIALVIFVAGYMALYFMPWYFLPLSWLLLGFSYTSMFSVGFNCSRGAFSRFSFINYIVGNFMFLPLLLPYESWHVRENTDFITGPVKNFWNGLWKSFYTWISTNVFCFYAFWKAGDRIKIIFSMLLMYFGAVVVFGSIVKLIGFWGILKFWFFPWLAYHFWMSTFYSGVINLPFTKGLSVRFSVSFSKKMPQWLNLLSNDLNLIISVSKKGFEKLREVPSHNLPRVFNMIVQEFYSKELNLLINPEIAPAYLFSHPELKSTIEQFPIVEQVLATCDGVKLSDIEKPEICDAATEAVSDTAVSLYHWSNINWVTALWILITPILSLIGFLTVPIRLETAIFGFFCFIASGLGITVGYHRLFSHRSFNCNQITKAIILLCGTSAFQNSCIWWARDHRAHHRYVDTDLDPYNINRGFFWAHMGWLIVKQDVSKIGKADVEDLKSDPMLVFQEKYYYQLAVLSGIIVPTMIAGLGWGDWLGGFFFASIARNVLVLQSTFCINSVAHYVGDSTFSDKHSPRDCYLVSFLTFGEGYHNFHHEFPYDYRNGVFWASWDPSKWLIWSMSVLGLTYNLKRFPRNEIEKGRLQMQLKEIKSRLSKLFWGPRAEELPVYTKQDLRDAVAQGKIMLVIDKFVIDATHFASTHPGGKKIIEAFNGRDATKAFSGGVYDHSNGAHNLLSTLRFAVYQE